ncbi:hypothetical protein MUK42_13195 [Musa troglodytarum]|uniref:Uncharacterized protein n=1 Tax=Musa troglodytarum TaxID=320322 RepID=A0A9E7G1F1_9LILI|nr:hypothetical protein MUK42_13195 [Musa troglodytarum]
MRSFWIPPSAISSLNKDTSKGSAFRCSSAEEVKYRPTTIWTASASRPKVTNHLTRNKTNGSGFSVFGPSISGGCMHPLCQKADAGPCLHELEMGIFTHHNQS